MIFSAAGQRGSIVRIPRLTQATLPVTGSVSADHLRDAKGAVAKIIVAAGQEWVEVPLTVAPAAPSYMWAPVVWFWSIVAPTAITLWVTTKIKAWFDGRQRIRDEDEAWRKTLIDTRANLDTIFVDYYPNLRPDARETWGTDLASRLDDWITRMPLPIAEEVFTALRNDPPEKFVPVLARHFPHWRNAILKPKEEPRA